MERQWNHGQLLRISRKSYETSKNCDGNPFEDYSVVIVLALGVVDFFRSTGDLVVTMLILIVVGFCHIDGTRQSVFHLRYLLVPHALV